MKKDKKKEERKQSLQPAAQALSDDDLLDVAGGGVVRRERRVGDGEITVFEVCESGRSKPYLFFINASDAVSAAKQLSIDPTVYTSDAEYWAAMRKRGRST